MVIKIDFTEKLTFVKMLEEDAGVMRLSSAFVDMKRLKIKKR